MTLRAALLAVALGLSVPLFAGATTLNTVWRSIPADWGLEQCLTKANQTMAQAGYTNIQPSQVSSFGYRNDYAAQIRCIPERSIVVFVVAGPDTNAGAILRDQLAAAFAAAVSAPSGSPPPAVVPLDLWSAKAQSAAKAILEGPSGDDIAASIQRITHPTGERPRRREVYVTRNQNVLTAMITVSWNGGLTGRDYETTVSWSCTPEQSRNILIVKDNSSTGIADPNLKELQGYFDTQIFRRIKNGVYGTEQ